MAELAHVCMLSEGGVQIKARLDCHTPHISTYFLALAEAQVQYSSLTPVSSDSVAFWDSSDHHARLYALLKREVRQRMQPD